MKNECRFSPCERYRYTLTHVITTERPRNRIMWIGLNPSTADENQLDPTLRRIRRFSSDWGFTEFVMTNLFAFRATDPKVMFAAEDPVGPENDFWLRGVAGTCSTIVAAWGAGQLHGTFLFRAGAVRGLLAEAHAQVYCVGTTRDGFPRHPLYVAAATPLQPFNMEAAT